MATVAPPAPLRTRRRSTRSGRPDRAPAAAARRCGRWSGCWRATSTSRRPSRPSTRSPASDWFFGSLGATLAAAVVGFAIAAVAGLWIGVTLGLTRFWGEVFEPVTLSVYSIPKVTLFPIFLTVFGFGLYSKVAFGMFHGIFPIMIIAMNATREVQRRPPEGRALAAAVAAWRRSAR